MNIIAAMLFCISVPDDLPIPDLARMGETNYGHFLMIGRDVALIGHERYTAHGTMRKNGTLSLMWHSGKKLAWIGSYRWDGEAWIGVSGLPERVKVEPCGWLTGQAFPDFIRKR